MPFDDPPKEDEGGDGHDPRMLRTLTIVILDVLYGMWDEEIVCEMCSRRDIAARLLAEWELGTGLNAERGHSFRKHIDYYKQQLELNKGEDG